MTWFSSYGNGVTEVYSLSEHVDRSPVENPDTRFQFRGTYLKDAIAVNNGAGRGKGKCRILPSILDIRLPHEVTQNMKKLVKGRGRALALSLRRSHECSLNPASDSKLSVSVNLVEKNTVTLEKRETIPNIEYNIDFPVLKGADEDSSPLAVLRENLPELEISNIPENQDSSQLDAGSTAHSTDDSTNDGTDDSTNDSTNDGTDEGTDGGTEDSTDDSVHGDDESMNEESDHAAPRKLPGFEEDNSTELSDVEFVQNSLSNAAVSNKSTSDSTLLGKKITNDVDDRLSTVVISNLPSTVEKDMIEEIISEFGEIKSMKLDISDTSQTYTAYVQMSDEDSAEYVVSCLDEADGLFMAESAKISCKLLPSDSDCS